MMLGVPGAPMPLHFLRWRKSPQIFADLDGSEPECPRAKTVQDWPIKISPEAALNLRRSEPSAILAIRPGRHQRREIAMPGSFIDLMLKPSRVHTRKLRVGQLAVARHHHDFRATVAREIRPVSRLLPAHF